jgi:hypothetical protein
MNLKEFKGKATIHGVGGKILWEGTVESIQFDPVEEKGSFWEDLLEQKLQDELSVLSCVRRFPWKPFNPEEQSFPA